jgi:hypothetical protein
MSFVKVRHDRQVQALPVLSLIKLEPSCFRTQGTLLLSLAEKFTSL